MFDRLHNLLPNGYKPGEFPGESLLMEILRRGLWYLVPKPVLRRAWKSILLGNDGYWCFILGLNNSGTTLLHNLLGRHPAIRTLPQPPEGQWHTNALPVPWEWSSRIFTKHRNVFRWTERDSSEPALRALHDWAFRYLRQPGNVLLEKSPPNVLRSRWLQSNFQRAHFIALYRHPAAVAEGIRRRESRSLRDAARHWAVANATLIKDLPHLDRCTTVRYEELCADPVGVLDRLEDFLGLKHYYEPEETVTGLNIHSLDDSVDTVENFNPRSFERLSSDDMITY